MVGDYGKQKNCNEPQSATENNVGNMYVGNIYRQSYHLQLE